MSDSLPTSMDAMIAALPWQIDTYGSSLATQTLSWPRTIEAVYIAGMGGSGIGGDFAVALSNPLASIPVIAGKRYELPAWIGAHTLVVLSSYSGGTEETLSVMEQAVSQGAMLCVVSSGGQAMTRAKALGAVIIALPDGWSSPRACLGFSMMAQLHIMTQIGALPMSVMDQMREAARWLQTQSDMIRAEARQLATTVGDRLPVIYADDQLAPVALRWRQQIQENAKLLAWHHIVPEMNHNELVGWSGNYDHVAVYLLRHENELPRVQRRLDLTRDIIASQAGHLSSCQAAGVGRAQQILYLIHLGDWLSYELALIRGVDPVEIHVIDRLKGELAQL